MRSAWRYWRVRHRRLAVRRLAARNVWEAQFAATTSGLRWDETPPWVRLPALQKAWVTLYPRLPMDTAWIDYEAKAGPHT